MSPPRRKTAKDIFEDVPCSKRRRVTHPNTTVKSNSIQVIQLDSDSDSNSAMNFFIREQSEKSGFAPKQCRAFFKKYSSKSDPEIINPEGIERLCTDLKIEPEDVVMLVLSWKMDAKEMGIYTSDEWMTGMTKLGTDSITKLRNHIPTLRACLNNMNDFKSIFRYSFGFAKESDQRCMQLETAKLILGLMFENRWPLFPYFVEFLEQSKYKAINKDQYFNILDFSRQVDCDLLNYDENTAWPVMFDEFVEWCRKHRGFTSPVVDSDKTNDSDDFVID